MVSDVALKVRSVTLFPEGIALVVREGTLPKRSGAIRVTPLPDALDGSVFYAAPPSARVTELRTAIEPAVLPGSVPADTVPDLLAANVGRTVSLDVPSGRVTGRLTAFGPNGVSLRKGDRLLTIPLADVRSVGTKGLRDRRDTTQRGVRIVLRARVAGAGGGPLRLYTLERAGAWSGSYLLDLDEADGSTLTGKVQAAMGALAMTAADLTLASGRPNLPDNPRTDLASGLGSAAAYVSRQQDGARGVTPFPLDPFDALTNRPYSPYAVGRPAFGPGLVPANLDFISYDPTMNSLLVPGGAVGGGMGGGGFVGNRYVPPTDQGVSAVARVDDVFLYPLGPVTLTAGERLTRVLFSQKIRPERLLRWAPTVGLPGDGRPQDPNRVRSILRLRNDSARPWTPGLATILRDGAPLAQADLPFTPKGRDADLTLGTVDDVVVTLDGTETGRKEQRPYPWNWRVAYRSVVTVRNDRDAPVKVELAPSFLGVVGTAEGWTTRRIPSEMPINPRTVLERTVELAPGEQREFPFTYERWQS